MLTNQRVFAILYKLSARDTHRAAHKDGANLENDTEKREKHQAEMRRSGEPGSEEARWKTVRFEELNAESEGK